MPDGLNGKAQAIRFSKIRKFFDSYACSRVMGRRTPTMNEGYISKKKAFDELDYAYMHCADIDRYGLSTALDVIDEIESADVVQVVHARWENYSPITIKCSRCGHVIQDWRYSECKYCPNCGAKMDGKE